MSNFDLQAISIFDGRRRNHRHLAGLKLDLTNPLKGIQQDAPFVNQLLAALYLLQVAAATNPKVRARRNTTVWRGRQNFKHFHFEVAVAIFDLADQEPVLRDCRRDKDNSPFVKS
jgi:hypothetical protein